MNQVLQYIYSYFLWVPILKTLFVSILAFTNRKKDIKEVNLTTFLNITIALDVIALITAIVMLGTEHVKTETSDLLFYWWHQILVWDHITLAALILCVVCFTIICKFSINYMRRDPYVFKFYVLIYVFQFSTCFFVFSESTQFLFMGWELLGLSSILLIAFYENKEAVLKNSLRVLVAYKLSDLFLFGSFLYLLHAGIHEIGQISNNAWLDSVTILMISLACLIKSGIFPWYWLPRAMEGPTTSSALFYGSIATHLPVLLFLRIWPASFGLHHPVTIILCCILVVSIIFSTLIGRQISDVKNSFAYATVAQLALIYLEVIFGFTTLAVFHTIGHAFFRGFEYLKSPSQLHNVHQIEKSRDVVIDRTGIHFEMLIPKPLRKWLYAITLKEFGLFKSSFGIIDHFLGLKHTLYNKRAFFKYTLFASVILLGLEFYFVEFGHDSINYFEEFFILLTFASHILALVNIYHRKLFWFFMGLSMILTFDILEVKLIPDLYYTEWLLGALLLLGALYSLFLWKKTHIRPGLKMKKSSRVMVLILGLSVVGIPGLGSYFVWENLVHVLSQSSPHLVLEAFYLMSLNTILFFVFYYRAFIPGYFESESLKKEPIL